MSGWPQLFAPYAQKLCVDERSVVWQQTLPDGTQWAAVFNEGGTGIYRLTPAQLRWLETATR